MTRIALILIPLLALSALPLLAAAQQPIVPCVNNCDFADLITLIGNVLEYLIYFVATPLAAIMFAVAGFLYLTAGDNEGKIKQAHSIFVSVLWGFGIMILAWAIVSFIFNFLVANPNNYSLLSPPNQF